MSDIRTSFNLFHFFKDLKRKDHVRVFGARDILKYIGPGLLVTVGFTDPGNWAANIAAGSEYGYTLLWIITLSTIMLVVLQHNVAHLGIVTGYCLSEAAMEYINPMVAKPVLYFAVLASVATSLAEILGGAIALEMLFDIPVKIGALLVTVFVIIMLFSNSYKKIEKWIIGFVSIIGISFLYELFLVDVDWARAGFSWVKPTIPEGSMLLIMSVLGAVVMPHNLFLHSEIIQSRQWHLEEDKVIHKQLKYEFADTLFSMIIGWAINSAIIIMAAATFFSNNIEVNELQQSKSLLEPLLGANAGAIFAVALLFSGVASSITSAMAGGSIFSGIFMEPYNIKDNHSRIGVLISLIGGLIMIFFIGDPFKGLILSQVFLSIQLPFTVAIQIYLTSSKKVMGKYANGHLLNTFLLIIAAIVTFFNIKLLFSLFIS
ncbi:MAG TPA: Nramp family divalent metal transporter [Bacteroidales bacterium]|nr:Nramp family divalent metal transporter [Bacteroidales bacterium]HPT22030.1 Nramp family divalent metal transporter [Bacteroidales bacterium]